MQSTADEFEAWVDRVEAGNRRTENWAGKIGLKIV